MVDTAVWNFLNWDARLTRDSNQDLYSMTYMLRRPESDHLHHHGVIEEISEIIIKMIIK